MKLIACLVILSSLVGCAFNEVYIIAQERAVVSNVTVSTSKPVTVTTETRLEGEALGDAIKAAVGLP